MTEYKSTNIINITHEKYILLMPYPHYSQDNFLNEEFAYKLQDEILNIPMNNFDRYSNPFENKYTLRNKYNFPPMLTKLFDELQSESFVSELSNIVGEKLLLDTTRNFWGIHVYDKNDKLDIHVDAGIHPVLKLKKQLTLGIYLSKNWKDTCGCELEIWEGDNASDNNATISKCIKKIVPQFNRMIMFTNNDYSWHGNPEPVQCSEDSNRIFVTISYLSENINYKNLRQKAFFVPRPNDKYDEQKEKLRFLRANPETCNQVYNIKKEM